MEQPRRPPEYILEVFADLTSIKDVVQGILHTIFFHRYFPSLRPSTIEVLDLTLPFVTDPELQTLIDTRVYQLVRQLSSTTSPNSSVRGQIGVQFFEKRRRKAGGLGWFTGGTKTEEEICWEIWRLEVTLATPKTETERAKVTKAMEMTLQKTALKIVAIVNQNKDHIPPITTSETNPFPYQINLNPRIEGWAKTIGIPEHTPSAPERHVGALVRKPRYQEGILPLAPAAFVKCLNINIDFEITDDIYGDLPNNYQPEYGCLEDVTYDDVDYSLASLLPQLKYLTQLNLDGILYQSQLERSTNLEIETLRTLKLRGTTYCWGLLQRGGERRVYQDLVLRWDSLARLQYLRCLEIGHVLPDESISLARAISNLGHLDRLHVSASSSYPDMDMDWHGTRPASLNFFLDVLCSKPIQYTLAQSIKSLAFTEGSWANQRVTVCTMLLKFQPASGNAMELYLDVESLVHNQMVLDALPVSELSRLAISNSALLSRSLLASQYSTQRPQDYFSTDMIDPGKSVANRIPLSFLDQITLVDIWANYLQFSISSWDDLFSAEDLVLGTKGPHNSRIYDTDTQFSEYQRILCTDSNAEGSSLRWNAKLQRIRIDQLEITDSISQLLSNSSHSEPKILMLCPWKTHYSELSEDLKNTFVSQDVLYIAKTVEAAEEEAKNLASQLAKSLPKLQVLILGGYWFWISQLSSTADEPIPVLWRFCDAQSDSIQCKEIMRCLTDRDWSFITEIPRPPNVESPGSYAMFQAIPAPEMIRRRNYMVLYRRGTPKKVDHVKRKGLSLRHERTLTDSAFFVE
ncbi:hypothetical protein MMC17_009961 [Xylographa soralifera]|nr:hypothetical protein [Xylographa soralifera]